VGGYRRNAWVVITEIRTIVIHTSKRNFSALKFAEILHRRTTATCNASFEKPEKAAHC